MSNNGGDGNNNAVHQGTKLKVVSPIRRTFGKHTLSDSKPPARKKIKLSHTRKLLPQHQSRTNDEIHSSIDLCPVLRAVVDTPQVQRLRGLKQLGTAEHVYMNANHNRFEHSMGVAHLARQMCQGLAQRQPQLGITPKDALCVELAGLLHDLGHGPFSHLYEGDFPKALEVFLAGRPELKHELYDGLPQIPEGWNHERVGLVVMDALLAHLGLAIDYNNLDAPLRSIGEGGVDPLSMRVFEYGNTDQEQIWDERVVLTSRDWVFIKELIVHTPIEEGTGRLIPLGEPRTIRLHESGYTGRPQRTKEFLYMIVANLFSGLDVDKLDYIARDQRPTFRSSGEIEHRILHEAVVAWADCPNKKACPRCRSTDQYKKLVVDDSDSSTASSSLAEYPDDGKHLMICYPDKMVDDLPTFFTTRFLNHKKVYRHKTTQAATFMIVDILTLADPYFRVSTRLEEDDDFLLADQYSSFPSMLPPSRASLHPISHLRLRDSILDQIMHTTGDPRLKKARKLIQRYWNRDFYKCVMERQMRLNDEDDMDLWQKSEHDIRQELLNLNGKHDAGRLTLTEDDIIIEKMKIHHGSGPMNPVLRMKFLPKRELDAGLWNPVMQLPVAKTIEEEHHAAHFHKQFQKFSIRVFCRSQQKAELLEHVCESWKANGSRGVVVDGTGATTTSLEQTKGQDRDDEFPPSYGGGVPLTQDDDCSDESMNDDNLDDPAVASMPLSQPDDENDDDDDNVEHF